MANKRKIIEISESESSETESEDVVEISSSTCDDDEYDSDSVDEDDDDEDYDSEDEYDDDDSGESESKSSVDEAEENCYVDMNDEDAVCNKVTRFLRDKTPIENLKWNECKVFLKRHGLRLTGTREECTERIKDFWRLKNGNGEAFYPRSSFAINCTGDVCQGDVVLFHQKVYDKFSKMKRRGSVLGMRTVAGRIVKESYGAAKQQHTFTVEVLWSKGAKELAPLVPLLVKGRNLYRMKTFRQRWKNENKRLEVLAEKHQRGATARTVRDMRKAKMATKMNECKTYKGAKSCKVSHHSGPSGAKAARNGKKTDVKKQGKPLAANKKPTRKNPPHLRASSSKQARDSRIPTSHRRKQNPTQDHQVREPQHLLHNDPSQAFHRFQSDVNPRQPQHFPSFRASMSIARPSHAQPVRYPFARPVTQHQDFNHGSFVYPAPACPHSNHEYGSRFPGPMDHQPFHPSYSDLHRWR